LHKDKNNKCKQTLHNCIERYGIDEGQKHWDESSKLRSSSLAMCIKKYGEVEGKKRYSIIKINARGLTSKQSFIKRYGEEAGLQKYFAYCDVQRFNNTLGGFIKRYGKTDGTKKFNDRMEKMWHSTSQEGYIEKYGEVCGLAKFKEHQQSFKSNSAWSKISQILFSDIYMGIKHLNLKCCYATHNDEYVVYYNNKNFYRLDFYIPALKLNIEFDGAYWHGINNGKNKKYQHSIDVDRDTNLRDTISNIEIIRVKELDYMDDRYNTTKKLINIIEESYERNSIR